MPPSIRAARERAVDLLDAVHVAQVEDDCRLEAGAVQPGLDAADDAAAAAEGRDGRLDAAGPVEDRRDVGLVAGEGDDVGRRAVVAEEAADGVGERLAVGVRGALVETGRADRGERRGRGDARRPEDGLGERRAAAIASKSVDAEALAIAGEEERLLLGVEALALAAPAEMLQALLGHGWLWFAGAGVIASRIRS